MGDLLSFSEKHPDEARPEISLSEEDILDAITVYQFGYPLSYQVVRELAQREIAEHVTPLTRRQLTDLLSVYSVRATLEVHNRGQNPSEMEVRKKRQESKQYTEDTDESVMPPQDLAVIREAFQNDVLAHIPEIADCFDENPMNNAVLERCVSEIIEKVRPAVFENGGLRGVAPSEDLEEQLKALLLKLQRFFYLFEVGFMRRGAIITLLSNHLEKDATHFQE